MSQGSGRGIHRAGRLRSPPPVAGGPPHQASIARPLPTGTVTFLFTDIQSSTRLWEQHLALMPGVLSRHDALIERLVAEHDGVLVRPRGEGDSRFAVFSQASAALVAAAAIQVALLDEPWPLPEPLCVHMALHTGEADLRQGDYYGPAVNRCARLRALAYGGQTLVSGTTAALVRDLLPADLGLRDLGSHRLKDLSEPERVFQLLHPRLPDEFPALPSASRRRGVLPTQPTPFIDRAPELHRLVQSLRQPNVRLLTLVGPGGIGKTRLAVAVAERMAAVFADGAWFVDISAIRDAALVLPTIAHTLGVQPTRAGSPLDQLQDYLRERHLLLVLDNCEQVLEAAADVARLLSGCPDVKVIATSREPLRLRWEHVVPVPSLGLPGADHADITRLAQTPAVAFFVQRARAADPMFRLTANNAAAVAELCAHLDGLPLALELAAAHVRGLPPAALLPRLARQFDLLRGTADAPSRQQSLAATVEWSYDLLTIEEQRLFRRLAVFAGGCTLDAVAMVCQDDAQPDVLAGLAALVDKSLVRQEVDADGGTRFRLLETMRHVALAKLDATDETLAVRLRFVDYLQQLGETAERESWGRDAASWMDRLEHEHDNFRAAMAWLIDTHRIDQAHLLVNMLESLWLVRGHLTEGRYWLQTIVAAADEGVGLVARARALVALGLVTIMLGDSVSAASEMAQRSLVLARQAGDPVWLCQNLWLWAETARARSEDAAARAALEEALELSRTLRLTMIEGVILGLLGRLAFDAGQHQQGRALLQRAESILRQVESPRALARVTELLGTIALADGDVGGGRRLLEQSVSAWRSLGDHWVLVSCLSYLGHATALQGDLTRAQTLLTEGAQLMQGQRDSINGARTLLGFAVVATARGQSERAVRLAGAAAAVLGGSGVGTPERFGHLVEQWLPTARAALGPAAAEVWASGQRLSVDQATAYALSSEDSGASFAGLTDRELEVIGLVVQGFSNRRIARSLVISERTAEAHVAHILAKLGLDSRVQIAVWGSEQGLASARRA